MRSLRTLAAGVGTGAAVLLSATPALAADSPQPAPPKEDTAAAVTRPTPGEPPAEQPEADAPRRSRPDTQPPRERTEERLHPEVSRPAEGPAAKAEERQIKAVPEGGVETGGGPVEQDDSALIAGGALAAAAAVGSGVVLVRRLASGRPSR